MKFLKYLLYVLGALFLIVLLLGLFGPKSYDVHRSAIVPGSPQQVWPHVSSLKNMHVWSPWAEKDSNMVVEFSGTDGTVGSSNSWKGNAKVGSGTQTITLLEPHSYVESDLLFKEPFESTTTAYTRLADTTGGTYVTWGIKGDNNFIGRVMSVFYNMDKMMDSDFNRGLANLSELMSKAPVTEPGGIGVMPGQYPGASFLGVRSSVSFSAMEDFYSKNFPAVFEALVTAGGTPASMPCGLYYDWDEDQGIADLAASVAFTGDIKAPSGMAIFQVPASRSLVVDYYGGYHGVGTAHMAIDAYMKENQLEQIAPVIEEYVTDPGAEPDSSKWLTKVVYLVK